jgi:hypothetical protein
MQDTVPRKIYKPETRIAALYLLLPDSAPDTEAQGAILTTDL